MGQLNIKVFTVLCLVFLVMCILHVESRGGRGGGGFRGGSGSKGRGGGFFYGRGGGGGGGGRGNGGSLTQPIFSGGIISMILIVVHQAIR